MDELRARKMAHNEALFREVNETIAIAHPGSADDPTRFICECADQQCVDKVAVAAAHYNRIRAHDTWFIVLPGHERTDLESVVERHEGFFVVEKPAPILAASELTDG